MYIRTCFGIAFAVLLGFGVSALVAGCTEDGDGTDGAIEYRNDEVSYADGESCVERYLLYGEDGTYERYIAGMYFGKKVPGIQFGTLFETGTYTKDESKATKNVTFSPKKQYSFDTKQLEYLGLEGQVPYYGTLTDATLTITWDVWVSPLEKAEVPIVYKRD